MTGDSSLPLAKMATINKPSFWLFTGACILLYIYNKINTLDTGDRAVYGVNTFLIWLTAFAGLFLTLITGAIKNQRVKHIFTIISYLFEIFGVILLGLKMMVR